MRLFRPRVERVTVTLRQAHPVAQFVASALGELYGRGINGHAGTLIYGRPGTATNRTKYAGYATVPEGFVGFNPKRVAAGHLASGAARLPTTAPQDPGDNPLLAAVATINQGAGHGYGA